MYRRLTQLLLVLAALSAPYGEAAYLEDVPQTLTQPDGTLVRCYASGDEYFHWLHDADGYVIVRDPESGFWVWAEKRGGEIVSSGHVVGGLAPAGLGLEPGIRPDQSVLEKARAGKSATPSTKAAPTTGSIQNLVIFVRFSDDSEFDQPVSDYDDAFNASTADVSSMKAYFAEVSFNQLDIDSTFYPTPSGGTVISYQDSNPRDYYRPYNAVTNPTGYASEIARTVREQVLLKNAVDFVATEVPSGLDIDADDDGLVDNVVFFVSGLPEGWGDLLWPHRSILAAQEAIINGARVWDYNFQLSGWLSVGVLSHEMFHSLGAPDLYHYSGDGLAPAGPWDVMDQTTDPPQHMTAYMKRRYGGWIDPIPEITTSGVYELEPLTAPSGNAYRIASPYSDDEYFVVEYRRSEGTFEASLPGSGLIVSRINTTADGAGNRNGPPDEVYVYRPGGTVPANGDVSTAHFSLDEGRTRINDSTDPSSFLSDATNGGLDISDIGAAGETISFTVTIIEVEDFELSVTPASGEVCLGADALFEVAVAQEGGFSGEVTLSSSGEPAGTTSAFSVNPVIVPGTSTFTVANTADSAPGTSGITITGTGSTGTHEETVALTLISTPGPPSLLGPEDLAAFVTTRPEFTWSPAPGAASYTLEIGRDPGFESLDLSVVVPGTSYSGAELELNTTYYWRVAANNGCGPSTPSTVYQLTTTDGSVECSNVVAEPGFEAGPDSAWTEFSFKNWFLVDDTYPLTGTYSAWLGGGNFEDAQIWQTVAIDPSATSARLTYWYAIGSNSPWCTDEGGVLVDGVQPAGHEYDLCAVTDTGDLWLRSFALDLTASAGSSVEIRFFVLTDIAWASSLFIDDVALEVCVPYTDPGMIFAEGFESGDTDLWDVTVF